MRRAHDIPAAIINLRLGVAQQYGGDKVAILKEAGLPEERLAHPTNRVSVEDTMNVWNAIVNQTGSHDIGLISGSRMQLSSLGMLGYLAMNSETISEAINKICSYQRLINSIAFLQARASIATTRYELILQEEWSPFFRYTIDFMMAALASVVRNSTPVLVMPQEVGFAFPLLDNQEAYMQVFAPSKVVFDTQTSYIVYSQDDLKHKMMGANSELFSYFEKELDVVLVGHDKQLKYTRTVRELIQKKLKAEIPRLEEVAKDMGMSTRSLQEQLKNEATSFRLLLNEVRKEVAMKQLKNQNLNVSEVAFLIGFSDIAVFSRSFKKWTGLSPSQYQLQS